MMEALWPGGPLFCQTADGFPLSMDSVLLAHFLSGVRAKRIMDLGCGAGALTVLLCVSHPGAAVEGIEIQPEAAVACRKNLAANGYDTAAIRTGDLREFRTLLPPGAFDLLAANPPYFPPGRGRSAPDNSRAAAREERTCTLEELCAAAEYLLRRGGAFGLVHRPERLSEIFCAMTRHGMEPKRMRLVQYKAAYAPNLALIEARRGGKPGLNIEKPLILCDETGGDSAEMREIYHCG
ncbi:MAG: methyltransferase [Oscillospiraceae bacterium]|nr:methyltransferase [Oscillospiraceae bacterium]MCD8256591.1 methyltransferase [Oscillospiraceae bacterium]